MQIAYDGIYALFRQFVWEARQNLDCFGHLLRIILALSGRQHFVEESGFELQEAIFNHLLT